MQNNLGMALNRQKKTDQAMRHLNKALEINPMLAKAYNNRGLLYYGKGLYDRAIPSDERWSLTIKANLPVQVVTWVLFLVVGFVFLREIILADQFRGRPGRREKNRRAGELMALSLWQAFAIVMFFSITVGRIMAAEDRGSIELDEIIGLSKWVSNLIPTEVYLGNWFLEPADGRAAAAFWVFPRAIVSWT
ncbi:unnamed protein product, partial [marine sediment metagenome]